MKYVPHPIKINLDRLEWDLVAQDDLMDEAGNALAEAKEELDIAEAKLEIIAAELSLKIREKPKKYGLKSVTEPSIKSCVIVQVEHRKQKWIVIRKKRKVGTLQSRVNALNHKKSAMQDLTTLYGQQYWSKPRLSKKDGREMDRKRKKQIRRGADDGDE